MRSKPPLVLTAAILFLALLACLGGLGISIAGADRPVQAPSPSSGLDEIAGSYYQGDGLGFNLSLEITASGTFTYEWRGCLGIYDQAQGRVTRSGDEIVLVAGGDKPVVRLLPVRWGSRHYLVKAEEMMGFVNEINQGAEPRDDAHGRTYLRRDEWDLRVSGPPELPPSYTKAILERRIEGTVLRKASATTWEVEVDGQSLAPGMELFASGEGAEAFFCQLKVVSVASVTAVVEAEYKDGCESLSLGDRVSTRFD